MNLPPELSEAVAAFRSGDLERARLLAEQTEGAGQPSAPREHLLGLIHCRRGDLAAGVEHLRRAADAEPTNAAFRLMLIRALVDGGRPQEALEMAEPPRDGRPASLGLWHARAEAAQAAEDWLQAADAWQLLARARPSDWRAWSNLGNALGGLDRWKEAAVALRQAVTLNSGELPIRRNFATALARAGLFDESADELRHILETHDDTGTRLTLARLYADLGRHEDSMAQLDEAARRTLGEQASEQGGTGLIQIALGRKAAQADRTPLSPADLRAVRELALLLERTSRMDELGALLDDAERYGISRETLGYPAAAVALRDGKAEEARQLLLSEGSDTDPVRWHRLMAKIEDSLGDSAAAFTAAELMHLGVPDFDQWRERAADYRQRLRALAAAITPDWASKLRPLEPGARRSPAFLVGFPRSGTTLLDTFLMGHPDTQVLEEFHMLGEAEKLLGHVANLPDRTAAQLEQARRAYCAELDRHVEPGFQGLVVDKLPLNMLGLPMIYSLFPDAKVIFAQRHPCDVVLSGFMQSFVMNDAMACLLDIEDAADLYDVAMDVWTRSREALPAQVQTLVYEELVVDPEAALRPLVGFLGLKWHEELLDHRSTAKRRGAIITPSYGQVTEPLDRRPSGRWRRYAEQLEPVLPVLLPWADRLGYAV